jgi:DNA-directed RNA polymerase sigma subunit (sigma70/sigma32)
LSRPPFFAEENSLALYLKEISKNKTLCLDEEAEQAVKIRKGEVITLYFGIGVDTAHTLEEIGQKFNLTRERVRQIKEKAIKRLNQSSRSKRLRIYKI